MTSPSDCWVSCYLVFLGTKVKRNNQVGTVASWGPTFRVAVDIIVHSAGSGPTSILRFTSTSHDCCKMGDRLPAIIYNSEGYLHLTSAVNKNPNYYVNFNIDFKKWYHIEIAQTKKNGKVIKRLIILLYEYKHLDLLHYQNQWSGDKECGEHQTSVI